MKYYKIIFLLCFLCVPKAKLQAQHRSSRFLLSIEKRYKLEDGWDLRFQQVFQASPEFIPLLDAGVRDETFDSINFLPEVDDDEDCDDDDDLCLPTTGPLSPSQDKTSGFNQWIEELNFRSMSSVLLRHRFSSQLNTSLRYQYVARPGNDAQQVIADITHTLKLGKASPFKWSSRLRAQSSIRKNDENIRRASQYLRLRGRIYMKGDISPYGESEIFYRLRKHDNEFRFFRLGAGLLLKLNKKTRFNIGYRYQERLNSSRKRNSHLIVIASKYRF